jgi:murein DD-endopeptidase MepM/ murein hydrolase activator NlpD
MKASKSGGLLLGLLVAVVTAGLAGNGVVLAPSPHLPQALASAAPAATTAAPPAPTAVPRPAPATPTVAPAPSATALPTRTSAPSSPVPIPSASPTATVVPTTTTEPGEVIGHSVLGRPIVAHRIGQGPIKVVLIGDIHGQFEANTHILAQELLAHFQAHPDEVPPNVSLWVIPTMNPDGLALGQRWNANGVDLNRNADTDLDGCAGNDWSPDTVGLEGSYPGAGGAYPFSEPEARAVRDFLSDAWVAIFYHSAAEAIYVDTCQRHAPTARLAEILSASTGYPVPEEGWIGYPLTGEFGDYLAGEGVVAVTVELADHDDPEFDRNLAGVQAVLANTDEIVQAEAAAVGAEFVWLDKTKVGVWRYADNSFIHPLALEVLDSDRAAGELAYLLDAGRVLSLDLAQPRAPQLLLAPGDDVRLGAPQGLEAVRVEEPLDLAVAGSSLLALDRAGDVYRYDRPAAAWAVERYDRPSRDTTDHYFVALSAGASGAFLLETTHEQVWQFAPSSPTAAGQRGAAWAKLPQNRDVDLSTAGDGLYVLTRNLNGPAASLHYYRDGQQVSAFQPNVDLMQPRQVEATATAVYVLDRAGRRLLALDPKTGQLLALYEFTDRRAVSAMWADPAGGAVILAGHDALYFYGQPERQATIPGGPVLSDPQPHDPAVLEELRGMSSPIDGASITSRDFQMPGAPRHYRLGVHEGMDFYSQTVGVQVDRRTAVHAIADGVVIRADHDYQPLTAAQATAWDTQSRNLGYTSAEVLDGYRGMQVWIDHGNGVVSRYAHLSSIAPEVTVGAKVTRGQIIGQVGNSGTPDSVYSATNEVHLHLEVWIGDHYVGQFLRPIEAREWLEKIVR